MVARLREKADETAIPVVFGDMATTRAPGEYALVSLVYNNDRQPSDPGRAGPVLP
jgi:hypothetical protein